ncbi:MAG: hypothetical protein HOP29_01140 [Phycisphaerales bacterium]|nr:hypothetical protein [Phycisphaerales bacterium]
MSTIDDWADDPFDPSDEDGVDEEDGSDDVLPCPSCGEAICDDAEKCPRCGEWVMPLSRAASRRHWVWIVAAVLAIGGMLVVTVL